MAPFSSSSSSHLSHDAVAKSLAVAIAAAAAPEREAHCYPFILPTTHEDAIPPITPLPRDNKGKRKMSQFFDDEAEAAPIANPGPGVSTHLTLHFAPPPTPNMPLSSSTLSDAQYDQGNGKMPQFFDFFASEFKLAVDTTTLPMSTDETGVSTHLSLLHFAGPPKKPAVVCPIFLLLQEVSPSSCPGTCQHYQRIAGKSRKC
ncbi:UNVERIFIED_CONTAM: hypothetical protein Sangu_0342900 [Sesamum angustifolium]|uniref:Uncharacterized protein n=1 Tax=Sesamum angustifolium TaxID=2727405 RepID=A0AAW2QRL9_9LAMI